MKYRSQHQEIALVLAMYQRWYLPNYKIHLIKTNAKWQTVTLDLLMAKEFKIGRFTGARISQDSLAKIIRLGFITNSKVDGSFEFEVDYILFK